MKSLPLVLTLSIVCATLAFAQKTEPKKPSAPAAPAAPSAPAEEKVRNVTADEAEKLLAANKDIVVLDVRTADEYEMGHIAGAKNVSFLDGDFAKNAQELSGKPILLHCASGVRSAKALEVLKAQGFPMIYHMSGGYKEWFEAKKPVVAGVKAGQ